MNKANRENLKLRYSNLKAAKSFSALDEAELAKMISIAEKFDNLKRYLPFIEFCDMKDCLIEDERSNIEWKPGKTDPDVKAVGADTIWRSGIISGMNLVWKNMDIVIQEGINAKKELDRRVELSKGN